MESDFDPQVIQDEINMLGTLMAEMDVKIVQMKIQMHSLRQVRAALAASIGVELPSNPKNQLEFALAEDGVETPVEAAE